MNLGGFVSGLWTRCAFGGCDSSSKWEGGLHGFAGVCWVCLGARGCIVCVYLMPVFDIWFVLLGRLGRWIGRSVGVCVV
jgi:hypothetical protein